MTKNQALAWVAAQADVARLVANADHAGEIGENEWEYDEEDGDLILGPMSSSTARWMRKELERLGLEASDARDSDSGESWVYLTPSSEEMKAVITERGNGFPDVGDYVAGSDGEVYEVVAFHGPIQTGRAGEGNWIRATVRLADWRDVTDDNEPICSAEVAS